MESPPRTEFAPTMFYLLLAAKTHRYEEGLLLLEQFDYTNSQPLNLSQAGHIQQFLEEHASGHLHHVIKTSQYVSSTTDGEFTIPMLAYLDKLVQEHVTLCQRINSLLVDRLMDLA